MLLQCSYTMAGVNLCSLDIVPVDAHIQNRVCNIKSLFGC